MIEQLKTFVPLDVQSYLSETLKIRLWAFFKVPLIFLLRPRVVELDDERVEVVIPLYHFTKNHWGSLYFAALAGGADVAGGLLAMKKVDERGLSIGLLFKDFKAKFIKRATNDTVFICEQGKAIDKLIDKVVETKERCHKKVKVNAYCEGELIGEFELTLSLKIK